jgi:protoheme IX farnesyltransferase
MRRGVAAPAETDGGGRPARTAVRPRGGALEHLGAYVALTKPRVLAMVVLTTLVGFYLGTWGPTDAARLAATLAGVALAAAGTMALNQWMERDLDARMVRTRERPLPAGRLEPGAALVFGLVVLAVGLGVLAAGVNAPCTLVTAAIAASYLLLYTPLKRVTPAASLVGAVPGALPPVAGWAAAAGGIGVEAWVLFAIVFLWQIPHTLAIGCVYRDDLSRAGFRVLSADGARGGGAAAHAVSNALVLIPVALLPTPLGLAGKLYFAVALALGVGLLWRAAALAYSRSTADARRLLTASLVYLPVLLATMALDKVPPAP